jgi:hypothetical protein
MANYSFKELPAAENGAVIEGHNMVRAVPHTAIYEGVTGLTFRNCNLTNCDVPADATVISCLYPCQTSFCSHLNPGWLAAGFLSQCASDCEHRTIVDTITIDSVVVDTNYTYEDKAVA